jgi:hypothetical protein
MLTALLLGYPAARAKSRDTRSLERPDLMDWLRSGRLTLVGEDRQTIPPERWQELPADVRTRALADFDRLVRGHAKAAVIYLR